MKKQVERDNRRVVRLFELLTVETERHRMAVKRLVEAEHCVLVRMEKRNQRMKARAGIASA